jgi:hemerythrin-like domain-containing protein
MKATDLLKEDHDRVEGLFQRFKENEDGEHNQLAKQIKGELDTHTHIEEAIFYPAAMKRGDKALKTIIREGLEEHAQVKRLLEQLSKMTSRNKTFNPKLKVVVENVEHHVEEEEGEMFPMVEDQFTDAQLEKLGARMEAEKKRFMKKHGITPAPKQKGMVATVVDKIGGLLTGDGSKPRSRAPKKAAAKTNGKANGRAKPKKTASAGGKKSTGRKPAKRTTQKRATA